jgi:hypothetical protein
MNQGILFSSATFRSSSETVHAPVHESLDLVLGSMPADLFNGVVVGDCLFRHVLVLMNMYVL